jgi:glycosyltransferase involved in cell wall biosynthesis
MSNPSIHDEEILPKQGGLRTREVRRRSSPGIPLVTVVTVVYNGEKHLEEAIRSVIGQDYENLEYIIVDGGSTDGSLDIIRRYQDRIDFWVSGPDAGIYDAMNKGIALASGELIGLLNADDRYEQGAIKAVAGAFQEPRGENDVVIVGKWNLLFEEMDLVITASPSLRFWMGMPFSHQAMFIPKKVYEEFGGYDTEYRFAADLDMAVRLFLRGIRFVFLDQVLVSFRTSGASGRFFRESAKEAAAIIARNLPWKYRVGFRVMSLKYLFLTSVSKGARRIFGVKAVSSMEKGYFLMKSLYSRNWEKGSRQ